MQAGVGVCMDHNPADTNRFAAEHLPRSTRADSRSPHPKSASRFLCEPNPEVMAESAVRLLLDEYLRERLSRNALEWAGEFL